MDKIVDKINKKIKELEDEIEDMKGSSPIVLVIPKSQLKVLKEIINSKPQVPKKESDNSSSKKDCYAPCINNQNNKCQATPEHLISSCGLRKRSPS